MKAWIARNRIDVALVVLAFVLLAPIVSVDTAQPASRLALTASVAEHHTVDVTGYPLGLDHAIYRGSLRSDKAPGQPLLAAPVYAVARLFGAESAAHWRVHNNLTLWWVTLWSSLLPFAALLVLMRRTAARVAPSGALPATIALGFGTFLLPFGANLYGHVLTAVCAFAAWSYLSSGPLDRRRCLIAGALCGLAVLVEYETLIVAGVLLLYVILRARKQAPWFALGGVPAALILGIYQWRAFGSPLHTPFAYYAGTLNGTTRGGYSLPTAHGLWLVLGGARGLLTVSPVALLALAGAWWCAIKTTGALQRHARIALVVAAAYIVLCAGWSGTPLLEEPGPRYAITMLPFLAVPLAAVWPRVPRLAWTLFAWGAALMVSAATTYILVPLADTPIQDYFRDVTHGHFAPTVWSMALGRVGVMLYIASVAGAVVLLVRAARAVPSDVPDPDRQHVSVN